MRYEPYECPICHEIVDLYQVVPHVVKDHPESGMALAIRAEIDREWQLQPR